MICPYRVDVESNGNLELFTTEEGKIVVYDDEYNYYMLYGTDEVVRPKTVRPSTREELKQAGIWDLVINKEDFSSVEDSLDEYLRIGEEIEKERVAQKDDISS